jgi:hypothetical protein
MGTGTESAKLKYKNCIIESIIVSFYATLASNICQEISASEAWFTNSLHCSPCPLKLNKKEYQRICGHMLNPQHQPIFEAI